MNKRDYKKNMGCFKYITLFQYKYLYVTAIKWIKNIIQTHIAERPMSYIKSTNIT